MSDGADQTASFREQFRDASNLEARLDLHARFSVGKESLGFRDRFDLLNLPPRARLLELGCGTGIFWQKNLDRIPPGWEITLSDFSEGMLQKAQRTLADSGRPFHYSAIDAQSITFPDDTFDAVLAYHVLFFVPDRDKALSEICRVLRPGGRLYASLNGERHMRELVDALLGPGQPTFAQECGFSCETCRDEIGRCFPQVRIFPAEGQLHVTELEPLVAYALSTPNSPLRQDDALAAFVDWAEATIRQEGAVRITTSTCLVEAF